MSTVSTISALPASPPIVIGRIHSVLVGRIAPYTRPGSRSAIAKQAVSGRVVAGPLGLAGDEQADIPIHGGPDKAIHGYAFEHYVAWMAELGPHKLLAAPGAFGENLSTLGVDEYSLCLGDQLQVGNVLLEVTQGRQPCWKLNDRFALPDMARRLQDTLRTGWYWRVLESGVLGANDELILLARPHPDWPIARLMAVLYASCLIPATLRAVLELPLVPGWRKLIEQRLATGQVESWQKRLDGPDHP